jgi:hypothetical protein
MRAILLSIAIALAVTSPALASGEYDTAFKRCQDAVRAQPGLENATLSLQKMVPGGRLSKVWLTVRTADDKRQKAYCEVRMAGETPATVEVSAD